MKLDLDGIRSVGAALKGHVIHTPVLSLAQNGFAGVLPDCASVQIKLEMFQHAGSFKSRGAWLGINGLDVGARAGGVVAASGGNHALAVCWAAAAQGVRARITMPHTVDPDRIAACRTLGAEVTLHDDMASAFAEMHRLADVEGATLMHPFEAPHMVMGSATLGAEYLRQAPDLDTLIIPIGGGGMIAGLSAAAKMINPAITVIGVEPTGADSMSQSFAAGAPVTLDKVATLADSLGAPHALPLTYGLARAHVDRIVRLPDSALLDGMEHLRRVMRMTAEPACAASLAALIGPLRDDMAGRKVGIIACGSNIGLDRFNTLLSQRT